MLSHKELQNAKHHDDQIMRENKEFDCSEQQTLEWAHMDSFNIRNSSNNCCLGRCTRHEFLSYFFVLIYTSLIYCVMFIPLIAQNNTAAQNQLTLYHFIYAFLGALCTIAVSLCSIRRPLFQIDDRTNFSIDLNGQWANTSAVNNLASHNAEQSSFHSFWHPSVVKSNGRITKRCTNLEKVAFGVNNLFVFANATINIGWLVGAFTWQILSRFQFYGAVVYTSFLLCLCGFLSRNLLLNCVCWRNEKQQKLVQSRTCGQTLVL